jgi:hypothetical protein
LIESDIRIKAAETRDRVERAIARMYAQPLPKWNPETLEPLTDAEARELCKTREAVAQLAREGLIEPCGERDGHVLWRITDLGALAHETGWFDD